MRSCRSEPPRRRAVAPRRLLGSAFVVAACAASGRPTVAQPILVQPVAANGDAGARPEAAIARQRIDLTADDGHVIALHAKVPTGPRGAIVLVHGRTWSGVPDFDLQVPGLRRSLMDALADAGWAAYAVDLRGYGATTRDATGWITPRRAAADLAVALEHVAGVHAGLPRPAVLGWSQGALVAQLQAQLHPESMSTLVLYGYPADPADIGRRSRAATPAATPARATNTASAAASDFISPAVIEQATIDAFVEAALAADPVRTDWRGIDEFEVLDPSRVSNPTLVIHGERDPLAPMDAQATLFRRLANPDRAWVVVAGGDHAAHLESTHDAFVHAVVGFLEQPRSERAAATTRRSGVSRRPTVAATRAP